MGDQWPILDRGRIGQNGDMTALIAFGRSCVDQLAEFASRPARTLATMMDGLDEIWVVDTFMD